MLVKNYKKAIFNHNNESIEWKKCTTQPQTIPDSNPQTQKIWGCGLFNTPLPITITMSELYYTYHIEPKRWQTFWIIGYYCSNLCCMTLVAVIRYKFELPILCTKWDNFVPNLQCSAKWFYKVLSMFKEQILEWGNYQPVSDCGSLY